MFVCYNVFIPSVPSLDTELYDASEKERETSRVEVKLFFKQCHFTLIIKSLNFFPLVGFLVVSLSLSFGW